MYKMSDVDVVVKGLGYLVGIKPAESADKEKLETPI